MLTTHPFRLVCRIVNTHIYRIVFHQFTLEQSKFFGSLQPLTFILSLWINVISIVASYSNVMLSSNFCSRLVSFFWFIILTGVLIHLLSIHYCISPCPLHNLPNSSKLIVSGYLLRLTSLQLSSVKWITVLFEETCALLLDATVYISLTRLYMTIILNISSSKVEVLWLRVPQLEITWVLH